jgi:hypothetical protein
MAAKPAASGDTGRRKARPTGTGTPPSAAAQAPGRERPMVDFDPWAVLLEHLTGTPEEGPAERTRPKRK